MQGQNGVGTIRVWDLEKSAGVGVFAESESLSRRGKITDLVVSPDGRPALSSSALASEGIHALEIWDVESRKRLCQLAAGSEPWQRLEYSPDGRWYMGTNQGRVFLWREERPNGWRTWTDATGKFSIEAEFQGVRDGNVTLKKKDGQSITIPLEKLSPTDQAACQSCKPQLAQALEGNDAVRYQALVMLGKLGSEARDLVPRIVELLSTAGNGTGSGPTIPTGRLRQAAEHGLMCASSIPMQAVQTLGQIGGDAAIGKIKELTKDPDNPLFVGAIEALTHADPKQAAATVAALLAQPSVSNSHLAAIRILPQCGPAGVQVLCKLLRETASSEPKYTAAVEAVTDVDASARDAADDLLSLLDLPDATVRAHAGIAIGAIVAQPPNISVEVSRLLVLIRDQTPLFLREIQTRIRSTNQRVKDVENNVGIAGGDSDQRDEARIARRFAVLQWAGQGLGKRRDSSARAELASTLESLRQEVESMRGKSPESLRGVQLGEMRGNRFTYRESSSGAQTTVFDEDKFRGERRVQTMQAQAAVFRTHLSQLESLCQTLEAALGPEQKNRP